MKISIVTVSYHSQKTIEKLLESLSAQTDNSFGMFLVNNSQDDTQEISAIASRYPFVDYSQNPINNGFAGGNNVGIKKALSTGADWIILLNPDTEASPELISELKARLKELDGIVGFPIQEPGQKVWGGKIEWLKAELQQNTSKPVSDFYVHGGAMAIHQETIKKIGYLDEEYFLYFEDVAYSLKAKEAGIKLTYLDQPVISHLVSASTKTLGSATLLRYHYRNALYLNLNYAPIFNKVLAIFWSVIVFIKQIFKIITGRNKAQSRAIMAGILDFYQEKMGAISKKTKIGIECEQIEGEMWGIGKIVLKTLGNIAIRPELADHFEFHLYFKSEIPKLAFLDNPIFHKKIIDQPFKHKSFVLYYYLLLPINLWFERLDFMFFPNYMLPMIFFGKSMVLITEDIYYEMRSKQQKIQHRIAYRIFTTWAVWWATKIMAISETSKKELVRLFDIDPDRIVVNHLAIDNLKSSLPNDNGDYLLFVGQAFPRRHLEEALLAFEKIAPDFPDLKFVAVGPDKYNPKRIKDLSLRINQRLGSEKVIWYEHVPQDQLLKLYSHSLATVYISSREAFGLPPLEALALGSVPIVADTALSHELFGDAAIFVSKLHSVDAIAESFRESMTNTELREKIKAQAQTATKRFTWATHTDRFLKIIESFKKHA